MADGFSIDEVESLIDSLRAEGNTFEMNNLNKEVQEILKYISKLWDQTVKGDKPTEKELRELKKSFLFYLQSSKATTKETRMYINGQFQQLLLRLDKLDKNRFMHSANAHFSNMVSQKVIDPSKKGAQDNVLAQLFQKGYAGPITKKMDALMDKLLGFLGTDRQQAKVRMKQLGEDLIEGLARSKFVGGAITDLIRLVTLFAGSWLKNFGPLGKALAVGLVALGPVIGAAIANILVKSLTSTITNVFKMGMLGLGTLLKATIMSFTNRALLTSTLRGAPTIARGSITGGNLAVGSFLAAGALGVSAANTLKQDGTRNKWAGGIMGLGSVAFGTAGIASLLAPLFPLLAPVAPIALAVGAIAAGIGLIVKFWPKITEFFTHILEKLGIIIDKDKEDNFKTGKTSFFEQNSYKGDGGTKLVSKKEGKELSANQLRAWEDANTRKAHWSASGVLLNRAQMTQERAAQAVEEYLYDTDPKTGKKKVNRSNWDKFFSVYEKVPIDGRYIKEGSAKTDWISTDGKFAYTMKGTMASLDEMNSKAKAAGFRDRIVLSSWAGTAGNYGEKEAGSHDPKGTHALAVNFATDITTSSGRNVSAISPFIKGATGFEEAKLLYETSKLANVAPWYHVSNIAMASGREAMFGKKSNIKLNKGLMEATEATLRQRKEELKSYEEEAKKDGWTDEEKERRKELKRAVAKAESDKVTVLNSNITADWTANDMMSRVLKDPINLTYWQQSVQ